MMGIYAVTNNLDNTIYIGSSVDIDKRLYQHKIGDSSNIHLQRAIKLHGLENFTFEILQIIEDENRLSYEEQFWIDTIIMYFPKIYNIEKIAGRPPNHKGRIISQETKHKISIALKRYRKTEIHIMRNADSRAKDYIFRSPDNKIVEIHNLSVFCKQHNLQRSNMIAVYKGRQKSCNGWTKYMGEH